ncbi:MAG TPA: deoxyribodipyrimidine photo-lyase [Tepidisphaeraceae bacterium]|jgi:deoxyribodipyrimidine photo-lyase|nr:deoxyribodipyrimidine photo-lyase [Tepidisphaeraceae bacterium]
MIQPSRLQNLNDTPLPTPGHHVLYWMQASQRTRFNHALEHAIATANSQKKPLVVCFGLTDNYPEANARHYAFMLQGLRDVAASLAKRRIKFVLKHGSPPDVALHYAKHASHLICDRGYTRHQKRWRDQVADQARCPVTEVESDVVVPIEAASDKQEYAARTIRPKITRLLSEYLHALPEKKIAIPSLDLNIKGDLDPSDPDKLLAKLKLDRSVPPVPAHFIGGQSAAAKRLSTFLSQKLSHYHTARNQPSANHTTTLSPYLHFGQISPLDIALQISNSPAPAADRESLLEELIIRRELACNFVHYSPHYDTYAGLPSWAQKTLREHSRDPRPNLYTLAQLESASTHDPYWNSAQREMLLTGYMHNYMRMYWGKKILEWSPTPESAYAAVLHLNNKYFLDGRGPNAFTNVAWLFGLHDRPWGPPRPIFGLIRYMNSAGLTRKFDMDAYVAIVNAL